MMVVPTLLHGLDARDIHMKVDFQRPWVAIPSLLEDSHTCAGAHLANAEIRIMLEEWLTRVPGFPKNPRCLLSGHSRKRQARGKSARHAADS
jgi:hypothetical protein